MNVEDVINEIWSEMERIGWKGMRWKKDFYLGKIAEIKEAEQKANRAVFEDDIVVGYGREEKPLIIFECGECHQKFNDRNALYAHYANNHTRNKLL